MERKHGVKDGHASCFPTARALEGIQIGSWCSQHFIAHKKIVGLRIGVVPKGFNNGNWKRITLVKNQPYYYVKLSVGGPQAFEVDIIRHQRSENYRRNDAFTVRHDDLHLLNKTSPLFMSDY